MERESNPMQPMCKSGCGFYGNPTQDGLCSVCYKDSLRKKQTPPVSSTPVSSNQPPPPSATASSTNIGTVVTSQSFTSTVAAASASAATSISSVTVTNTAQPTVHSVLFSSENKDSETIDDTLEGDDCMLEEFDWESDEDEDDPGSTGELSQADVAQDTTEAGTSKECEARKSRKRKIDDESGASCSGASSNNSVILDGSDDKDSDKDGKKKKNRCATCRKKVGLTGFECRCGGLFCAIHRYSDKHECSFDYRELGAAEIRRNNPVVVGEKIQKI